MRSWRRTGSNLCQRKGRARLASATTTPSTNHRRRYPTTRQRGHLIRIVISTESGSKSRQRRRWQRPFRSTRRRKTVSTGRASSRKTTACSWSQSAPKICLTRPRSTHQAGRPRRLISRTCCSEGFTRRRPSRRTSPRPTDKPMTMRRCWEASVEMRTPF